ncbi:MAG TPA: hypothetical protein VFS23_04425 [Vicinamibacterales bacterium]|nr:hypothetical protein [Vicinamibacterales bacterium]
MSPTLVRNIVAMTASGCAAAALVAAPSSPVAQYFSRTTPTDYLTHAQLASEILSEGIRFPHFLWHVLVVAVHTAAPWLSWMDAAQGVVVVSYGLQGAALAWVIATHVGSPRHVSHLLGVVLLTLLFVTAAPVTILTWREEAFYFGYLNMESYASPTHALLKPLALVTFVLTCNGFSDRANRRDGIVLASTSVLSALAKPSLTICLLPAAVALSAWRWLRGQRQSIEYLALALVTPSALVVAWQYWLYFGQEGSRIMFAPLLVMGYYANGLAAKFVMSILLPLTVLLVYRREALRDPAIQLAWLQFALAASYTYLLAESREPLAGNFAWTGQIATYLLFVTSAVFALGRQTRSLGSVVCVVAFAFHVISGILFFLYPFDWGRVPPA